MSKSGKLADLIHDCRNYPLKKRRIKYDSLPQEAKNLNESSQELNKQSLQKNEFENFGKSSDTELKCKITLTPNPVCTKHDVCLTRTICPSYKALNDPGNLEPGNCYFNIQNNFYSDLSYILTHRPINAEFDAESKVPLIFVTSFQGEAILRQITTQHGDPDHLGRSNDSGFSSPSSSISSSPSLTLAAGITENYACPKCHKSYSRASGLCKHDPNSKKSIKCKDCNKVCNTLGALKMHLRTHTLPCKCTLCGKAFSRPWLLQGHIRTHTGEKPYACSQCPRAFADKSNLRAHLQTHSQKRKYSCKDCCKSFSRVSLLSKHLVKNCNY